MTVAMSMSREDVYAQIRATLVEDFDIEPSKVTEQATLIDDLGLDSIDAIDMAVRIQQMTESRVEEDALKELRTVGDAVNLVLRLLAKH